MDSPRLIDSIVRQTTVLIAQLATATGIRAPLAHIADQVFLDLALEIERQGVGRKVVADMFGLALRTYQKKVQRLTESVIVRDKTLWEAVLDHLLEQERVRRREILEHFAADGEEEVGAVLNDLVGAGLIYSTGRGSSSVFRKTTGADQHAVREQQNLDSIAHLIWLKIYREGPLDREELLGHISNREIDEQALALLAKDRRITEETVAGRSMLRAGRFVVPVGAEQGWEAAVFDHFSAVAKAIASKIRRGRPRSSADDVVGGATLSFDIHDAHPREREVYGLLARIRGEVNELWNEVAAHNRAHPVPDDKQIKVTFYFGQNVESQNGTNNEEGA